MHLRPTACVTCLWVEMLKQDGGRSCMVMSKASQVKAKRKLHRALTDAGEWWMAYYGALKFCFCLCCRDAEDWKLLCSLTTPTLSPPIAAHALIHNGWEYNVQFLRWEKASAENSTPNEIDICFNGWALAGEGLIFHKQQPVIGST